MLHGTYRTKRGNWSGMCSKMCLSAIFHKPSIQYTDQKKEKSNTDRQVGATLNLFLGVCHQIHNRHFLSVFSLKNTTAARFGFEYICKSQLHQAPSFQYQLPDHWDKTSCRAPFPVNTSWRKEKVQINYPPSSCACLRIDGGIPRALCAPIPDRLVRFADPCRGDGGTKGCAVPG